MHQYRDTLEHILHAYRSYQPDDHDGCEQIVKAFEFAKESHEGQVRKSGDSYITHPLASTIELMNARPDSVTIVSCLLHDTVDDGTSSLKEIRQEFGPEVAGIIEGIGHIGKIKYRGDETTIVRLQRTFVAMAQDIRVMFVKFADRIHNLKTLEYHDDTKKADRVALESLMVYAPIAARLGMYHFKSLLEEFSFRWLEPEAYARVTGELAHITEDMERFVKFSHQEISEIVPKNIPYEITYRVKKPYSIYRKMKTLGVDRVEEVYDVFALRILTDTIEHCYMILGHVHGRWKPVLENIKDFIGSPKPNGYQSLHTTVIGLYDERRMKPTEIQIRTYDMHEQAEYGSAAHFGYKEGRYQLDTDWIDQLGEKYLEHIRSGKYFEDIEPQTCAVSIFVFTPAGDIKELAYGATPVDFAYAIHTDIGHATTGAKVNGKIVPLGSQLENGDVVEIMTDKNSHPSSTWLEFVATSKARQQISIEHKRRSGDRDRIIERGQKLMGEFLQETFEEELDEQLSHLDIVDGAHLDKEKKLQLLYIIGSGKRKPSSVFRSRLRERSTQSRRSAGDNFREHSQDASVRHVIVGGERNMDVKFAGCCRPVFPDAIIGVVRRDGTCNVHRGSCGSLKRINPARQLEAYWEMLGTRGKYIQLRLVAGENGDDLIFDAVQVFYDMGINVIECRQNFDQHGADVLFTLEVSDQNKNISGDIRTRFSDRYPEFELHFSH